MAGEYKGGFDSVLHHGQARRMAMMGRGGDSTMAHMTPGEVVIPSGTMTPKLWSAFQEALDQQGMMPEQYVVGSGQNSINPMTGQPEFLAQAAGPGRSVRDYQERRGSSNPTGRDARESERSIQQPQPGAIVPNMAYPRQAEAEALTAQGVPQDQWQYQGGQFGQTRTADLGPLTELLPGPIRAGMRLAGIDPTFDYFEPAVPTYSDRRTSLGRESSREQGLSGQRAATQQSFIRPEVVPAPQFLGLTSAMSPLQMRSAIASRAIAGQGGEYTSPEAASFYDNLLQRSLIGDTGDLFGLDTLLPIDLQYLAQIRGIENPADTRSLLSALAQ